MTNEIEFDPQKLADVEWLDHAVENMTKVARRASSVRLPPRNESRTATLALRATFTVQAAEAGDAVAQFELGSLYAKQEVCQCTTVAVG
jgi:TPR repeat protein